MILNQIVKKRDILDRMLPRWDSNQQIVINEEYLAACSFNKSPSISAESAYNEIRITSSLIEDGYIYAVLTLTANDPRNTTSY